MKRVKNQKKEISRTWQEEYEYVMSLMQAAEKESGQLEPRTELESKPWRKRACLTLKEASEILSTPVSQIRKLCHRGVINPITGLGRKWRIATEDIDRLLNIRLRKIK